MGERHGFRGEGGLSLGGFGLFGFLRGEVVVVVEDRMLRKMRDISTLSKEKGEDREEDEEKEVEQPRQDRKGRV